MKTAEGTVAMDEDNNKVVIIVKMSDGDVKHPLNIKSIGGKEYAIGEKVNGVITDDGHFNIYREYKYKRKGRSSIFGFISKDELEDDLITITLIKDFKPKSDLSKEAETVQVRREWVNNYYDNNENKR